VTFVGLILLLIRINRVLVLGDICHEIQSFAGAIARSGTDNVSVLFGPSAQSHTEDHLSVLSHACSATAEVIEEAFEFPRYGGGVGAFDGRSISKLRGHLILMKERKGVLEALYKRISSTKLPVLLLGRVSVLLCLAKLTETIRRTTCGQRKCILGQNSLRNHARMAKL
jgi:hypothetical protein